MRIRLLQVGYLGAAIAAAVGAAWSADNAPIGRSASGTGAAARSADAVTLNFVNADIEGVVKAVSEITGRYFVLDPRVRGTVNVVSPKPMSRALAYEVFLSALRLQGFAAVEDRGVVKIVPEGDAKLHMSPTAGPGETPRGAGDQIQTRVFTLKYESATQLLPVLRPLVAPNNSITAYQNSNSLVVTDYASNLQRIEKIIGSIDRPGSSDPVVIALRYASALDLAQTVNRVFTEATQVQAGTAPDPLQRFTVAADTRTNSLLVRAGDPSRLTRIREFVAMLDQPTGSAGNIHVIHLKNAEAVKIAETLRGIYSGEIAISQPRPVTPGSSPTQALPPNAPTAPSIIQADAATNSIIITAPDAIYNNLRAAVEKLDVRRAQVYVEALIAEITADRAAEFGIQWQNVSGIGSTGTQAGGFGGTNFGTTGQNIIGISQNAGTTGRGLNVGVIKGVVTIPGVNAQILNLGLLVRALESDNNANILSTPTLLTLDNEEAKIVIGQNVPLITGQYAISGAATTPTPFQTIERRDVGLTLRIKPQISEGGTVRLQIFQEVSSIQDRSNVAGLITAKRSVESTVLVDDGQIVVIGGLIQDSVTDGVEKVPVLGDIPILGGLFKYNTRTRSKTNLMVFLRPTVLRDAQRAEPLTNQRYEHMLSERENRRGAVNPALPDFGSPSLPPSLRPESAGTPTPR